MLPRLRDAVPVFPNNAINCVNVEVMAAGACVCRNKQEIVMQRSTVQCTNLSPILPRVDGAGVEPWIKKRMEEREGGKKGISEEDFNILFVHSMLLS
jgi:hypothetical protein